MTARDLITYLENWAPPGIAWEIDNVGLQVGSRGIKLKNILLCLELNEEVLKEALKKDCNFIFTHHPLIFKPIQSLDKEKKPEARLIEIIIKKNITVYTAHTNLDLTKDGVSIELAKTLKLKNIRFLEPEKNNQFKVVVFVPEENLAIVSDAVFSAGGGIIGEYQNCSFHSKGLGTFQGSEKSNPSVGKKLKFEKVEEVRLEFIVDSWNLNKVISSLIQSHPYEEPAYDIYPLKNKNVNFGDGAIGLLPEEMSINQFLEHVSKSISASVLRYCNGSGKSIHKVAVCGGAGAYLLNLAIANGADAFVTADIKYHAFQDANTKILFIDAGHYETEIHSLNTVKKKLESFITPKNKVKVFKYSKSTNPIKFYKH